MKDRTFKYKKPKEISPARLQHLRDRANGDECKFQFLVWAESTWLEVFFGDDGEPVFRPAIYAWHAWKAAWAVKGSNA